MIREGAENKFKRKTHGRIYVRTDEDVINVRAIIKNIDEFEYEYLPDDFVTVLSVRDYVDLRVVYGHKFEMDMDVLSLECLVVGIPVFMMTGRDEFGRLLTESEIAIRS